MRISHKAIYGVQALVDLAMQPPGEVMSVRSLAARQHIPVRFLEQIFLVLRKEGIVQAQRGSKGGFMLALPAKKVRLLDVLVALEGEAVFRFDASLFSRRSHEGVSAAMEAMFGRMSEHIETWLARRTLHELAGEAQRSEARPLRKYNYVI